MNSILVIILIIYLLYFFVTWVFEQGRNSASPLLNRKARVITKRQHIVGTELTVTEYFVTFEYMDGSRGEWQVRAEEYGLLAEKDEGTLKTQGSWFMGFDRDN
jgi:hypothetical protein